MNCSVTVAEALLLSPERNDEPPKYGACDFEVNIKEKPAEPKPEIREILPESIFTSQVSSPNPMKSKASLCTRTAEHTEYGRRSAYF